MNSKKEIEQALTDLGKSWPVERSLVEGVVEKIEAAPTPSHRSAARRRFFLAGVRSAKYSCKIAHRHRRLRPPAPRGLAGHGGQSHGTLFSRAGGDAEG